MRFSYSLVPALAALAAASPLEQSVDRRAPPRNTACAKVADATKGFPPGSVPFVPAQLAWDCLQSVPLNLKAAIELIDSLRPYLEWQSTTAYLKNPPAEYVEKLQASVDIWAGLAKIRADVASGVYTKEYDYAFALYTLFQSTHDGHLTYVMDIVGSIFGWGRPMALVSVSNDGQKLPSIFAYQDVVGKVAGEISYKPSPIKTINGEPAVEWLLKYLEIGSLQDRDALWNDMFFSLGQASLGPYGTAPGTFAGGGRGRFIYPGPQTEIGFANGTETTLPNFARVYQSLEGVKTGQDMYERFFAVPKGVANGLGPMGRMEEDLAGTPTAAEVPVRGTPWPGYPKAIERHSQSAVAGYFIPDAEYDDIAVLAMPSFLSSDAEFQRVVQDFIADAKKAGKKKLVIDVSANGGGQITEAYSTFKQLFPQIEPEGWTRFRAHEAFDISGQKISQIDKDYPRDPSKLNPLQETLFTLPMDYRADINKKGEHFRAWGRKYGPHVHNDDKFSSIIRWNLNDPLVAVSSPGILVAGYQNRTSFEQPWAAEDIVIVYDGYCASTCTIFSEMMRSQAGVEAIALGGRPQPGIIQAVGGVKGTNNYPWRFIQQIMGFVGSRASKQQRGQWKKTLVQYSSNLPFYRAGLSEPNINSRDGILPDDPTQTPTQFIYEPADCRILYTPEMTVDATAIWKAAVDSKWRGKSRCIAGGVGGYGSCEQKNEPTEELDLEKQVDTESVRKLKNSMNSCTDLRGMKAHDGLMRPY